MLSGTSLSPLFFFPARSSPPLRRFLGNWIVASNSVQDHEKEPELEGSFVSYTLSVLHVASKLWYRRSSFLGFFFPTAFHSLMLFLKSPRCPHRDRFSSQEFLLFNTFTFFKSSFCQMLDRNCKIGVWWLGTAICSKRIETFVFVHIIVKISVGKKYRRLKFSLD